MSTPGPESKQDNFLQTRVSTTLATQSPSSKIGAEESGGTVGSAQRLLIECKHFLARRRLRELTQRVVSFEPRHHINMPYTKIPYINMSYINKPYINMPRINYIKTPTVTSAVPNCLARGPPPLES